MKQTAKLLKVKTPLLRKDTAIQIRCEKKLDCGERNN